MKINDSPEADQVLNDMVKRKNNTVEAHLFIKDVLGVKGPLTIDGIELDAVVHVRIVHTGSNTMSIEYFEIDGNVIDMYTNENGIVYVNYDSGLGTYTRKILNKFTNEVEQIAIEMARNTPEEEWDYRLIE